MVSLHPTLRPPVRSSSASTETAKADFTNSEDAKRVEANQNIRAIEADKRCLTDAVSAQEKLLATALQFDEFWRLFAEIQVSNDPAVLIRRLGAVFGDPEVGLGRFCGVVWLRRARGLKIAIFACAKFCARCYAPSINNIFTLILIKLKFIFLKFF